MASPFLQQLGDLLHSGGFSMVNPARVHKAIGGIEGEQISFMWRGSVTTEGDHLGLLTSDAFYIVKITGLGIRYSLSKVVRYSDLIEASWASTIHPGFIMVVARFRTTAGTETYLVGTAHNEMERPIVERKAEHLVSTVTRLAERREAMLQDMVNSLQPLVDEIQPLVDELQAAEELANEPQPAPTSIFVGLHDRAENLTAIPDSESTSESETSGAALEVAEAIAASGGSTFDEISEALDMTLVEVSRSIKELERTYNIVRLRGGVYRFAAGVPVFGASSTPSDASSQLVAPSPPASVVSHNAALQQLSVSERIEKLESAAGLLDRGLITLEDFDGLRREILSDD